MEAEPDTPDVAESGVAARHRTLQLHVQQLTALGNKPELVELNMTQQAAWRLSISYLWIIYSKLF